MTVSQGTKLGSDVSVAMPVIDGVGKVGADGGGRGRTDGRDWGVWEGWSGGMGVVMGRLLLSTVTRKGVG